MTKTARTVDGNGSLYRFLPKQRIVALRERRTYGFTHIYDVAYLDNGWSMRKIADKVGISERAIRYWKGKKKLK